MNKTILITRPNHDGLLNLLFYWTEPVISLAKKKGFVVLDLKSKKSNKKDFDSYLFKNNPSLIFFNGHGSDSSITGYNNEPLVTAGSDEKLLKEKVVYSRTCSSAAVLGTRSIKAGCKAFIGYIDPFWLPKSKKHHVNLLEDKVAGRFLEPTNLIPTTLIKGHTALEADRRSKTEMSKNYVEMVSSTSSLEERSLSFFLYCNIVSQVLIGNPDTRI